MASTSRRALHYVLKISDRNASIRFFKDILGMQVLRHEEFEEGCKATCNGPYDGKWSKTMIGYGPEDDNFVLELTYNYGVKNYVHGNDLQGITIDFPKALDNVRDSDWPCVEENDSYCLQSPTGYPFYLAKNANAGSGRILKVTLACSQLVTSKRYWSQLCGMNVYEEKGDTAVLGFADDQCKLELRQISEPVERAQAFGRIAFSCPSSDLSQLENGMVESKQTILTPLVTLDTPGKASVQVVILGDPDGHEICFVGDEAFRELSKVDPNGDRFLASAMEADKSNEWFAKRKRSDE